MFKNWCSDWLYQRSSKLLNVKLLQNFVDTSRQDAKLQRAFYLPYVRWKLACLVMPIIEICVVAVLIVTRFYCVFLIKILDGSKYFSKYLSTLPSCVWCIREHFSWCSDPAPDRRIPPSLGPVNLMIIIACNFMGRLKLLLSAKQTYVSSCCLSVS